MSQQGASQRIGIVGAGLLGRLVALACNQRGWHVSLFDRDTIEGSQSCGYTGAGMLSPYAELESAEPQIAQWGIESLQLWPNILAQLEQPVFFQQQGSLIVSHPRDRADLARFQQQVAAKLPLVEALSQNVMQHIYSEQLAQLEPELSGRFSEGIYFPLEGQLDNRDLMPALALTLQHRVVWHTQTPISEVNPYQVQTENGEVHQFDCVIDCRGLGANLKGLRGVRGEILILQAPDVTLNRLVRLMHPRYPIYVVPRANHRFIIGATSIESQDFSPVSVQSMMELLSTAYTIHPGFAEARILEASVNCRPAFVDNLPQIQSQPGLVQANGLYRHGFLISPVLTQQICERIATGCKEVALEAYC